MSDELASYTAGYRRSALAVPATLRGLALLMALLAWAVTNVAHKDTLLFVVVGGVAGTILFIIAALLTALRVHRWVIETEGLRIDERPRILFTGFANRTFATCSEIIALRRIESGFEQQIEVETRSGAMYRMAPGMALRPDARGYITDHTGLEAFTAAIGSRLVKAEAAMSRVQEGLSFWNRLPGLAILCLMFAASVAIAGGVAIAFWSGAYLYGALMKAAALVLVLPLGAGYLLFKSVKRRLRVLKRP